MSPRDRAPDINVGEWLARRAGERGRHVAVVLDATGERTTYAELNALANRVARAFANRGVGPGDRVALALASEPLALAIYFALAKLGAVSVPLNTRLALPELAWQLADCEPRAAIRDPALELPARPGMQLATTRELRAALPERADEPQLAPGGERPQTLRYTSGSTGLPKGAVLPHRKTLCNTLNAQDYLGLSRDDVVVVPVPLFHSFGLKILSVPALFAGATVVLVDRFDPLELQRCIARRGATLVGAVPVMYRRMLQAGLRPELLRSLRLALAAGAPLDVETVRRFGDAGVPLTQAYGQTETSILCCLPPEEALRRAGSVGRPVGRCELRIADEDGKPVPPGVTGEIQVRGGVVMLGYWDEVRAGHRLSPGDWHRTGDLAVMDADGFVTLAGRRNELYISGGENVYPAEVERVLEQHENVSEVAVVGVPDVRWGETGRAYVVPLRAPLDPQQLRAWARERLAAFKVPSQIVPVPELPRTASGKVRKHALVDRTS